MLSYYIGLNNITPSDDLSTDAVLKKVELVQQKFKSPSSFPNGFPASRTPSRALERGAPRAIACGPSRCYEAVLRCVHKKPCSRASTGGRSGPTAAEVRKTAPVLSPPLTCTTAHNHQACREWEPSCGPSAAVGPDFHQ